MYHKNKRRGLTFKAALTCIITATLISCEAEKSTDIKKFGHNVIEDINILSSDEFEGRAPATQGAEKTIEYITSRFSDIGLKPANSDSYLQEIPLIEVTGSNFSDLIISGNETSISLNYLDDMVVGSYRLQDELELKESELVFAGYGIVAPEYNWNDYKDLDVEGKTVVVMVNDPGFATKDDSMFTGSAMTYYGRWTYKFEEAARQGAAGALIIHQTEPASYGWDVVRNSWSGTQYGVVSDNENLLEAEGWISKESAKTIFESAGVDFEESLKKASQKDFSAIDLNLSATVSFKNSFKESVCNNVIGYIEGSKYPEETIIYMGHWDHLGMVETEDGVDIYNGAVDNATGIAGLLAMAEKFKEGNTPSRSIVFMAVTAEESGLLGSRFYSDNPLFPLATTVAGINMDALNVYGPTNDVTTVGYGFSEMDNYLKKYADKQERVVKPNPYPERGYYYRSDHFNLARKGVPMIYAKGGSDYIGKDEEYAQMVSEDYNARYHDPSDVVHDLWCYDGIYQDLWLFYYIGKDLANSDSFPNWAPDSEFRAVRDKTVSERRR
ncbi:M28 family metallopeptidase [Marinilabiliaceae bacterium ANBcel2]|nr:M28 family metallopeptidase [Marinilabiliaceae bacterium ANBcel2]